MDKAQLILRLGVTTLGGLTKIGSGVGSIGDDALSARIKQSQSVEGLRITGARCLRPITECERVVARA